MKYTFLIMKAQMKNIIRWRTAAAIIFGVAVICIIGVSILFITQFILPQVRAEQPDRQVLENILGLILFFTSFCAVGIYASVMSAQSLLREKARGNIQALLATPVKASDICLGKTLGVFVPGFLLGTVMTILMLAFINLAIIVPAAGFVFTPWMLVSSLAGVPLFFLVLGLLVHLIGLTGKAATGNIIAQLCLAILPALMINLSLRNITSAASWLFLVVLLGLAAIAGIFSLVLRRKLTAERIMLSQ
jgi:ABC-type Na+ efflux pump permease subunit